MKSRWLILESKGVEGRGASNEPAVDDSDGRFTWRCPRSTTSAGDRGDPPTWSPDLLHEWRRTSAPSAARRSPGSSNPGERTPSSWRGWLQPLRQWDSPAGTAVRRDLVMRNRSRPAGSASRKDNPGGPPHRRQIPGARPPVLCHIELPPASTSCSSRRRGSRTTRRRGAGGEGNRDLDEVRRGAHPSRGTPSRRGRGAGDIGAGAYWSATCRTRTRTACRATSTAVS